jgi:hypothetical protein
MCLGVLTEVSKSLGAYRVRTLPTCARKKKHVFPVDVEACFWFLVNGLISDEACRDLVAIARLVLVDGDLLPELCQRHPAGSHLHQLPGLAISVDRVGLAPAMPKFEMGCRRQCEGLGLSARASLVVDRAVFHERAAFGFEGRHGMDTDGIGRLESSI